MASAASARKAWNDAMKATAAAALPPGMQQRNPKRRSGRNKKQDRRTKARKVLHNNNDDDEETKEFCTAVWVDALEGVDPSSGVVDDDEEYDELEDIPGEKKKRGGSTRGGKGRQKKIGLPKRFLPRTLASILIEEASRGSEGVAKEFINAEAKLLPHEQLPRRKFCPVTGQVGIFVEPKSGIPYANYRALEQIKERPPPWMTLGGAAAYLEAIKSIPEE